MSRQPIFWTFEGPRLGEIAERTSTRCHRAAGMRISLRGLAPAPHHRAWVLLAPPSALPPEDGADAESISGRRCRRLL
jgi:hypothetical protein